jgi:hypothetical protein
MIVGYEGIGQVGTDIAGATSDQNIHSLTVKAAILLVTSYLKLEVRSNLKGASRI